MKKTKYLAVTTVCLFILLSSTLSLQGREKTELKVQKVADNLHCISNAGGNIAVLEADNKLLLIDAGYARTAGDVAQKLYTFSPFPVKMLINTHHHRDHTGGNPVLGKDAEIIAHANCRKSMMAGLQPEESPKQMGIPALTFKKEKEIRWGDETIRLIYFGPGHTNGDIVVVFPGAKVIHTGDLFFNGMAPYIDVKSGSDTGVWVKTIRHLAETHPDFTVIPGHGPITDMKAWSRFADYLETLRNRVKKAIAAGKTREQAMETIDVSAFNDLSERGNFMTRKNNIGWIYDELTRK